MTDNEIGRERYIRAGSTELIDNLQIVIRRVLTVHRRKHIVRPRLYREMQIRHQRIDFTMGGDQIRGHITRMRRGVANTF